MNGRIASIGIVLCLLNALLCQAEVQDRLLCALEPSHEPCDFEQACDLRACELTHDGFTTALPVSPILPDRSFVMIDPPAVIPGMESGGNWVEGDLNGPGSRATLRGLALLQRFLC